MVGVLSWVALGLGVASLAHVLFHGRRALPPALKPLLGAIAALLVVGALLTLPVKPPWSPGQTLAPGLLLGGLTVVLAALAGRGSPEWTERDRFWAAAAQASAAAAGIGVLLVFWPRQILDALGGYALGAVAAALVLNAELGGRDAAAPGDELHRLRRAAEMAALTGVALAATTWLATFHRAPTGIREWQPLPALFLATLGVGLTARGVFRTEGARGWVVTAAAVLAPVLVMTWLIAYRLRGTHDFLVAAVIGLVVFALIHWLVRSDEATAGETPRWGFRPDAGLLAALLVLGGAIPVFRELFGYGLGVLVLGGLAATLLVAPGQVSPLSRGALTLGLLLVLQRVYTETTGAGDSLEPDYLYYYVVLVLGALLPAFLAGLMNPRAPIGTFTAVLRVLLAGALAAAAPLGVWLLAGERAQPALLVGLAVGTGFLLAGWARSAIQPEGSISRLLAVAAALSASQFTFLLEPLALRTRSERIAILIGVAAVALFWMASTAWLERRKGSGQMTVDTGRTEAPAQP
jgi:hypothetical protein